MALVSPGSQVTIIDESQYLPAAPNSIPLVILATAQNKINASGTGVASGTTKANAGKLYQITSQRDLVTYFGNPFFYKTTNGTPIHGYELNEYGLLAGYSVLGSTNLIYALRADIDLGALVGKTSRPSSAPANGAWWLDTGSSTWGVFEFNASTGAFTAKSPIIVTSENDIDASGAPRSSLGVVGSYAVVLTTTAGAPDSYSTYWYKSQDASVTPATTAWVAIGSPEWQGAWPVVQSTVTSPALTGTTAGNLVISRNGVTATITGTINDGSSGTVAGRVLTVTSVAAGATALQIGTLITGTGVPAGTYIDALITGTGSTGTYHLSQSALVSASVAQVTASIGAAGASSNTLTVTGVTSGALSVGTLITGTSDTVAATALQSGVTYTISAVGSTDWTSLGATASSTFSAMTSQGGTGAAVVTAVQMVVTSTPSTSGTNVLGAGRYVTGGTVNNGTYIIQQDWKWTSSSLQIAAAATAGDTQLTLNAVTGLSVGDLVLALNNAGTSVVAGIPAGTTITNIAGSVITLSNAITVGFTTTTELTFYSPVTSTTTSGLGGRGIYKLSSQVSGTGNAPIAGFAIQPAPGTQFTTTSAGTGSSGTGTATISIASGTYITALGTGTGGAGTYTISGSPQYVPAGTVNGYRSSFSGQHASLISLSSGNTIAAIITAINAARVPFLTVRRIDNRINMYVTDAGGEINIGGDSVTLEALGITGGVKRAPAIAYGTNANQPLWRTTDSTPRPTGSVWVKTNAVNGGMSLSLGQYSTTTGAYASKSVTISTSDAAVNAALDSTGGKSIPLNTVYAQYNTAQGAPLQLFYRAQTGASAFTGTVSAPTGFVDGSQIAVRVSSPGSSELTATTSAYIVTINGSATASANDATTFVDAWLAANIPYTDCYTDSITGAIVIEHTEGGVIMMYDSLSLNSGTVAIRAASPLDIAGFTPYTFDAATGTSMGTPGAKEGEYQTVNATVRLGGTSILATGGTGSAATFTLTTNGFTPTFTVSAAGAAYVVGDVLTVTYNGTNFGVKVTGVDGSGGVTSVVHASGVAVPEYAVQLSAWEQFEYTADDTEPVENPADGTLWFHSVVNQVDLMVQVNGSWVGYRNAQFGTNGIAYGTGSNAIYSNGVIVSASEPEQQPSGSDLVNGDIWLDSGDLENYPMLYRRATVDGIAQWVKIDNADQTTEKGIVFADARWGSSGAIDPVNDPIPSIVSLTTSNYVDLDAPDASLYPQGTILFNTRRSGYTVKKFVTKYFTSSAYPDAGDYNSSAPTNIANRPAFEYAWVTASGNKSDGSPYMGRKAQRAMVVKAMKAAVDSSSELREEATFYNLIAAPGYAELQPNMITLNNDRNNTAYIVGDTPLRLANDANALTAWATNAKGATGTGDDGFVTRDTYLGVYYPSAITTDLTGSEVVVPASHMILRTMIYNDTVAYPWFAPAGMRRGAITNVTNIGYIDADSGEFQTTKNRVALRDVQYSNFINPIAYFQNVGILNYGNKNSYDSQSALDRTNVARLVCYIRDRLQVAVRPFIFEPNDAQTRSQVRDVIVTLFADIKAKRGIYDYLVVCDDSNNTAARIDRNELWIDIAIEPVKAIEFIYIPVRIMNTGEIGG